MKTWDHQNSTIRQGGDTPRLGRMTTLEQWAVLTYGDMAPTITTLRSWARDGRIYPIPEKHGRSYFVDREAVYVSPRAQIRSDTGTQGIRSSLVSRLMNERAKA
jgi:hypothetical protein